MVNRLGTLAHFIIGSHNKNGAQITVNGRTLLQVLIGLGQSGSRFAAICKIIVKMATYGLDSAFDTNVACGSFATLPPSQQSTKTRRRIFDGHFQAFSAEKAHGYCVLTF
jgi:hypothetical protein